MSKMKKQKPSMAIKSYFAGSVESAIQRAREQLGADAMLITSRRSSREARHLGAYEVVFGVGPDRSATDGVRQEAASSQSEELSAEVQVLRTQLDDIKRVLKLSGGRSNSSAMSDIDELFQDLVAADLDQDISRSIVDETSTIWRNAAPGGDLRTIALDSIGKKVKFAPEFGKREEAATRIVAFVGPPGAGKTTTLTKIAIQECLAQRLPVRIISVDSQRVAAHEKLRTFAGILGINFTAANTMQEFIAAVDEYRGKNLLLIDTPGLSAGDFDDARDLSGFLGRLDAKELHLVLPASMKRVDMIRCVRQFEDFKPEYLLFTKLDETESFGGAVSLALQTGKSISFLATGQGIPEDLEAAAPERLLSTLFTDDRVKATSAA
jgi:flagellar biosynthesis protein FlhF